MTLTRQRALILAGLAGAALSAGGAAVAARPTVPASVTTPALAARPGDDGSELRKVLDDVSPSIVTIKLVLKFSGGGFGEGEQETETVGVMIDPKGIVLASSVKTGGTPGGREGGPTITPTEVKVLVGDDTEGKKATILTRDSELDLAWIRIDETGANPYKNVDLASSAAADVGQRLYVVDRLGKFFDRTPVISEGRVRGIAEKPRHLFVPSDGLVTDLGLPVFNVDGKVIGVTIVQFPDSESMGNDANEERFRLMILPAEEVVKATKRAMEHPAPPPAPDKPKDEPVKSDKPAPPKTDKP